MGDNLARFADAEEKRWRKEMGFVPVRCASCAFRKGTYPNGCLSTVSDAMKCSMQRIPFYCHHDVKLKREDQDPKTICGGWILLHNGNEPVRAPWPWSNGKDTP